MSHRADHLAAVLHHHRRGVALERVSEGVIGGQEEPGIAAALGDFLRGADRERARVEHPLQRIRIAEFAVEVGGAGRMGDKQPLALAGDGLHRKPDGRNRHVDNQIDMVAVVPLPGDAGGDVGLDLMVGGNDLDRLAQNRAAEILDRHLRGHDRARAVRGRGGAGHVGEDADLQYVVGNLCPGRSCVAATESAASAASHKRRMCLLPGRRMSLAPASLFADLTVRRAEACLPRPRQRL